MLRWPQSTSGAWTWTWASLKLPSCSIALYKFTYLGPFLGDLPPYLDFHWLSKGFRKPFPSFIFLSLPEECFNKKCHLQVHCLLQIEGDCLSMDLMDQLHLQMPSLPPFSQLLYNWFSFSQSTFISWSPCLPHWSLLPASFFQPSSVLNPSHWP